MFKISKNVTLILGCILISFKCNKFGIVLNIKCITQGNYLIE